MGYGPCLYYKYNFSQVKAYKIFHFDFTRSYGKEINALPLNTTIKCLFQVMIGDGQEGPFELEIHHLSTTEHKNTEATQKEHN